MWMQSKWFFHPNQFRGELHANKFTNRVQIERLTKANQQLAEPMSEECVWELVQYPRYYHYRQPTHGLTPENPESFLCQLQSDMMMSSMMMQRENLWAQCCSISPNVFSQMREDLQKNKENWKKLKKRPFICTAMPTLSKVLE